MRRRLALDESVRLTRAATYNLPRKNGHRMDTRVRGRGKASQFLPQNRAFVPYDMRFL